MNTPLLFLSLTLSLLLCGSVTADTCSNNQCGGGDLCCAEPSGAKCYNPETYSCPLNEKGEKLLCGYIGDNWFPAKACGGACYNEYEHSCCNGELYSRFNTKQNPCLNPPGTFQPGCERCGNQLSCCVDATNGAQCYTPGSYLCLNNTNLCVIQEGVPNLVCGRTCYNTNTHTCCRGELYSKFDRMHPCAPPAGNTTVSGDWDIEIDFTSNGFSSPGGTACGWTASSRVDDMFELHNCSNWFGAGGFHFDEASYLASFTLPLNAIAFVRYELDIYIDNTQGVAQTAAFAVLDNDIASAFRITNDTLYTYPCNTNKLYTMPVYHTTITIEAGFSGYKTIDVTSLATWSFSTNPADHIQILISSFSNCGCYNGNCCYEGLCAQDACSCESSQNRFSLGGLQSSHPPALILTV